MFGFFRHRRARWLLFGVPFLLAAPLFAARAAFGHGGPGGCGHHGDPAEMASFATKMVDRALTEIQADDAQRAAIQAIAQETLTQMGEVHEEGAALRTRFKDAIARGADAAELEALRAEGIALADRGSRIGVDRLAEVRAQLNDTQWQALVALHDRGPWGW